MNVAIKVVFSICAAILSTRAVFANLSDPRIGERTHILKNLSKTLEPTKRIFFFGDSLSDSDLRLHKQTRGMVPPFNLYWNGHFTNGPTWNQYLSTALDIPSYSYALAGARIVEVNNYYVVPPTMKYLWSEGVYAQINKIDADKVRFSSEDLIAIWIGGNDYLLFPDAKKIDSLIWHTRNIINRLKTRGARRFVLLNIPDVTLTPWHSLHLADIIMPAKKVKPLIIEHNSKLKMMVDKLRDETPELKIALVDIFTALNEVTASRDIVEISEIKNPCIGGEFLPKGLHPEFLMAKKLPQVQCSNPESYFYWDPWHPTTKVHCLAAVKTLESLVKEQIVSPFNFEETIKKCMFTGTGDLQG